MNLVSYDKAKKNCLLTFCNKRTGFSSIINGLVADFSSRGYHFEKVSGIAFDNSIEIINALTDSIKFHENIVICCPSRMEKTLKDFFETSLKVAFDGLNTLKTAENNIFIFLSDSENKLSVTYVCDYFDNLYGCSYKKAYIRAVGLPDNLLDNALKEAKNFCPELQFNIIDNFGDSTLEIVYDSTVSKSNFDKAYRAIVERANKYIYALDNISLAERLVQLLKLRRMKISVAESFTGGGISKRLVEIAGVSEVYFEGLNTYANESKRQRLEVGELVLKQYGAVSKETAAKMAEGLLAVGNCDISISTTGIAGPKSDNTNKPVGLVYIGIATADETQVYEYNLKGSRKDITETAINLALFAAFKKVK